MGPTKFIIEGIDRTGKDTLANGIMDTLGYHLRLHYSKPERLTAYAAVPSESEKLYQEASFRTLLQILTGTPGAHIICNRAHLGEFVYAPLYRAYSGSYVFDLEREYGVHTLTDTRLLLLVENFETSTHFIDDGKSIGSVNRRREEQDLFIEAFQKSAFRDKRMIRITDDATGCFRPAHTILNEVLA